MDADPSLPDSRAFTGAWIETIIGQGAENRFVVAPSRARGLKQGVRQVVNDTSQVAPSRARGLKQISRRFDHRRRRESRLHGRVD